MTREEPTLRQKISALPDEAELDGFRGQLEFDGRLTSEAINLIELRRAEIKGTRK